MHEIKFKAYSTTSKEVFGHIWCMARIINFGVDIFNDDRIIVVQYTGLKDKNGKEIYEGDIIRIRRPYRNTQTHTGDNIPNGSYTEPMEPGIKELEAVISFSDGCFFAEYEEDGKDVSSPLFYEITQYDESSIKESIASSRKDIWDEPEEGDLQYLLQEYPPKTLAELIDYLSGVEIIGSIHDNPELLNPIK